MDADEVTDNVSERSDATSSDPSDEVERTWKVFDRRVIIKKDVVIKAELPEDELLRRLSDGKVVYPWWPKERLQNEAAALTFIAKNTSIPVPTCRLYTERGLVHLETKRIKGGVQLIDLKGPKREAAAQEVGKQMQSVVLPQLRKLRRRFIGSIDHTLPVFPPSRIYGRDRRNWPRITSDKDDFVFCHNDLGPQNIFVNPETFQIVGIIDWEFSGFFPPRFELPLWTELGNMQGEKKMYNDALAGDLAFFGLEEGDLQDNTV